MHRMFQQQAQNLRLHKFEFHSNDRLKLKKSEDIE